jgi:hypothetical protein
MRYCFKCGKVREWTATNSRNIYPHNKRCMCSPKGFDDWWEDVGSAIRPNDGADHEEHAKRIAKLAWDTALYEIGGTA